MAVKPEEMGQKTIIIDEIQFQNLKMDLFAIEKKPK